MRKYDADAFIKELHVHMDADIREFVEALADWDEADLPLAMKHGGFLSNGFYLEIIFSVSNADPDNLGN